MTEIIIFGRNLKLAIFSGKHNRAKRRVRIYFMSIQLRMHCIPEVEINRRIPIISPR